MSIINIILYEIIFEHAQSDMMLERYSKFIMRHPKAIIAVWVVAILVALPFAAQVDDVMEYDMTSMGGLDSESEAGQSIVDENFVGTLSTDTVLVIPYDDEEGLSEIESNLLESGALENVLRERYGGSVTCSILGSYGTSGSDSGVMMVAFSFGDGISSMDEVGNIRAAVSDAKVAAGMPGLETYVTGSTPIAYDTMQGAGDDVAKIDPLSILLILILLGLFFATLVTALVPPLVVGAAYGIVLSLIFAVGTCLDVFYITRMIVLVSMLGAGVDYSIFIISRYREERKSGRSREDSLSEAVKWAGESVFTSGMAVIIGFAVMALCSYQLVSTMAVCLALGIIMAMLAALTLIPAVIAIVWDKVFWPRSIDDYAHGSKLRGGVYGRMVEAGRRYFTWAGRFSTKHAKAIVAVAILVTVPLGYVAVTSEDSFDMVSVMPDSEARGGVDAVTENTDGGLLMPTYALIQSEEPVATVTTISDGVGVLTWTSAGLGYLGDLSSISSDIVSSDGNVSYTMGPTSWSSLFAQVRESLIASGYPEQAVTPELVNRAIVSQLPDVVASGLTGVFDSIGWSASPDTVIPLSQGIAVPLSSVIDYSVNIGAGLVSVDGRYMQIMVVVSDEPMSQGSMDTVANVRSALSQASSDHPWITCTWVIGTPAVLYDISELVNDEFTLIELGVIVLIYVLLLFVLGSYLTPVRSLATIMMSVVWTLGVLQLVFAQGMGVDVIWIVPIVLFVICLGLGMDYDILLTTRIREGKLRGLSNDDAIRDALFKSGSIITLCGLIMGGTFLTLLLSGSAMLQEIGFALGFAILVDSLIVVPYVVPALMHLMGDWSWKGPGFLARRRNHTAD